MAILILFHLIVSADSVFGGTPPNDDCENAELVEEGMYTRNNLGATTDGTASCGFFGQSGTRDVWFLFVAGGNGTVTIDTCDTVEDFDSVLSVFNSCGGIEVACNDDVGLTGCNLLSKVEFAIEAGNSYWIRIAEFFGRQGEFILTISSDVQHQCSDDYCTGAESHDSCPADCATLADFADFQVCFGGSSQSVPDGCDSFDIDGNDRVDLADFEHFASHNLVGP